MRCEFFANDAAEGVPDCGRFSFGVLTESSVDERFIAGFAARRVGDGAEVVKEIFVEANGDFHLSFFGWWFGDQAAAFAFAEIVFIFHC